jgi:hypothetical protein
MKRKGVAPIESFFSMSSAAYDMSDTGNTISCEVIRGPIVDGHRVSLALIKAQSETKPPTTTFYPPSRDMTGIKVINLLVDSVNYSKVTSVLLDPTTPTPDVTGYQLKLFWNGDCYARSNPVNTHTNGVGSVRPSSDPFKLSFMMPPADRKDELTVAFLNQYPTSYNSEDRVAIRKAVLNDEFTQLQTIQSTTHVVLYIHPPVYDVYSSLIPHFESYWKEVIPMDSFYYFTNDCFGKNVIGGMTPLVYSISVNTSFKTPFMKHDPLSSLPVFDQCKARGITDGSFHAIDVGTTALHAGSLISVLIHDPVDQPFHTITMSGLTSTREPFLLTATPHETRVEHSDVLIDSIMSHEHIATLGKHDVRQKWMCEHMSFVTAFQLHSCTSVFYNMTHDSRSVNQILKHVSDTVSPVLYRFFQDFYTDEYKLKREVRTTFLGQGNEPRRPVFRDYPLTMVPSMMEERR